MRMRLNRAVVWLLAAAAVWQSAASEAPCLCSAADVVDDCACSLAAVDAFNNQRVLPLLHELLQRDFFRYYKVNLEKTCPFWPDDRSCGSRECGIESCDERVPDALKRPLGAHCEQSNEFDPLDATISGAAERQFADWARFDDAENKFCDADDDNSSDMHYVDLLRNPERYTGYAGGSAQRVWASIYNENCFKPNPKYDKNFLLHPTITGLCLEKRVFYRLISGLHTGITVAIAAHCYKPAAGGFGDGSWFRNVDMFGARFGDLATKGEGSQRLRNLYFVYVLEMRALAKVAPYLRGELFYTGDDAEDEATRDMLDRLFQLVQLFPHQFDESAMYLGVESRARQLKEEFRQKFLNISRIMDCVDCDKCRLWGKLQTHGIGAALKILSYDIPQSHYQAEHAAAASTRLPFQLTRNEVVALLQSFGRFAANIGEVAQFRLIIDR